VPEKLRAKYRAVFLQNVHGTDVLADILVELCKFGCTLDPDNKVMVSQYNVGVAILQRLGTFSEETLDDVIRALANIVPMTKEDKA
jgi:hypothetical protein